MVLQFKSPLLAAAIALEFSPGLAQAPNDDDSSFFSQLEQLQHNTTALSTIQQSGWVSAPNMRGTSDILYSCLLTLFACVYTSHHLNIPKEGAGYLRLLWDKISWMCIALFAPELVLMYATTQLMEARKLAKDLRGILETQYSKESGRGPEEEILNQVGRLFQFPSTSKETYTNQHSAASTQNMASSSPCAALRCSFSTQTRSTTKTRRNSAP